MSSSESYRAPSANRSRSQAAESCVYKLQTFSSLLVCVSRGRLLQRRSHAAASHTPASHTPASHTHQAVSKPLLFFCFFFFSSRGLLLSVGGLHNNTSHSGLAAEPAHTHTHTHARTHTHAHTHSHNGLGLPFPLLHTGGVTARFASVEVWGCRSGSLQSEGTSQPCQCVPL